MAITLGDVLARIDKMPEPPKATILAINLLEDPNVPIAKTADFIAMDESLTVKLLRHANSSFYGFSGKVSTVREAIVRLGSNVVKCALYSTMLEAGGLKTTPFFYELWRSGLFTALAAKDLGQLFNCQRRDLCFTAGLLTDIGQILMNECVPELYPGLVAKAREYNIEISEAESKVFGFHHVQVATKLADAWKLPIIYQNSIRYHHHPERAIKNVLPEDLKIIASVYVANQFSPLFCQDPKQVVLDEAFLNNNGIWTRPTDQLILQMVNKFESYYRDIDQITQAMFGTSNMAVPA